MASTTRAALPVGAHPAQTSPDGKVVPMEPPPRDETVRRTFVSSASDVRPSVCRPEIAPRLERAGGQDRDDGVAEDSLWCESNGSEGCYGGWELVFRGPWLDDAGEDAGRLDVALVAEAQGFARGADALVVEAFWHASDAVDAPAVEWDPLFVSAVEAAGSALRVRYANTVRRPPGATELRLRCGIRWADRGRVRWHGWQIDGAPPVGSHRRLRLGVASARPPASIDRAACVAFFVEQCRRAGEAALDLVCLPELILASGMERSPEAVHAAALPLPGAWLAPFQDVARRYRMGICFSVYERAGAQGEVVYNTAVLLGRDGGLIGKYRKVHLALAEARNGVAAGHEFPVFDFDAVQVGMAICMDSTPLETARILAQQGAEVLLMPIMGDFRATPWVAGDARFHRPRWESIQRAHALDNHLYVVVARNGTQGSAVTAPWGEILACDDGTQGLIWADADVDDVRAHPRGSTIRSVLRSMRRPAVYTSLLEGAHALRPMHREA